MFKLVPLDFTNTHADQLSQLKGLSLFKEGTFTSIESDREDKKNYFEEDTIEKSVEQISGSYDSVSKLILRKLLPKKEWEEFISKDDQFSLSTGIVCEVNGIWPLVRQYSTSPFFSTEENEVLRKKILSHIVRVSESLFREFCFRMKAACKLATFSQAANLTRIKAQINLEASKRFNVVSTARLFQEKIANGGKPVFRRPHANPIPKFIRTKPKKMLLPVDIEIKKMQEEMPTLNLSQLKTLLPSARVVHVVSKSEEQMQFESEISEESGSPPDTPAETRVSIARKWESAHELRQTKLLDEIMQDMFEHPEDEIEVMDSFRPQSARPDVGRKQEEPDIESTFDEDEELPPAANIPPLIQAITRREIQTKYVAELNEKIVELDKREEEYNHLEPIPQPKYQQPSVVQVKLPHKGTNKLVTQMFDCRSNESIDLSNVILTSYKPLFNELSDDVPSNVVKELDSNLFRDGELKEVYNEILKTVHDTYTRYDDDPIVVKPPEASKLDMKLLLDPTQYPDVINPKLDVGSKPLQLHQNIDNTLDTESEHSKTSKLLHHVYQTHSHGDGKAYSSWLSWWKATITSDDYFKFLSFQKLDFLQVSFHFYEQKNLVDTELMAAMLEQRRKQLEQLNELKAHKYKFVKGEWNVNTVLMGGLGKAPTLPEPETTSTGTRSRSNLSSTRSKNLYPSAATDQDSSESEYPDDSESGESCSVISEKSTYLSCDNSILSSRSQYSTSGTSKSQTDQSRSSAPLHQEYTESSSGFVSLLEQTVKSSRSDKANTGERRFSVKEFQFVRERHRLQSIIKKNIKLKLKVIKQFERALEGGSLTPRQDDNEKLNENSLKLHQSRLEKIWTALKMSEPERLNYALKYGSDKHAKNLPEIIEVWENAVNAIIAREKVLSQLEVFEEKASDPNRYFLKGRNVRLLEEAKVRSKFYKKLKNLEKIVAPCLNEVKRMCDDTVTYFGRNYMEKMSNDKTEMLYWLQQKRREKAIADYEKTDNQIKENVF